MPAPTDWDQLTARDIMRTEVITVAADASLQEVERLLGEHGIGGVPVTNQTGHIIGVVSMRDLIARYAQNPDSRLHGSSFYMDNDDDVRDELEAFEIPEDAGETAADIMTPTAYTIDVNCGLVEIATEMVKRGVHRILVTEEKRKVGFLSSMDVLRALAGTLD